MDDREAGSAGGARIGAGMYTNHNLPPTRLTSPSPSPTTSLQMPLPPPHGKRKWQVGAGGGQWGDISWRHSIAYTHTHTHRHTTAPCASIRTLLSLSLQPPHNTKCPANKHYSPHASKHKFSGVTNLGQKDVVHCQMEFIPDRRVTYM